VITPLIYFGGVFHSLSMLPPALKWLTIYNPMFYMISGLRYGMLGTSDSSPVHCAAVVLGCFLVLFVTTVGLFRSGYKLRK
jgi:ABC-2 type transport system permease protein